MTDHSTFSSEIAFAGNPLNRASQERTQPNWLAEKMSAQDSMFIPLFAGDPLIIDNQPAFLAMGARSEFPQDAPIVFLGIDKTGTALFALDATVEGSPVQAAPFADLGSYKNLREIAAYIKREDLAILGQARWLLDWHRRHQFCANCGQASQMQEGGAKRHCESCGSDHFPRTEPVAIVLVEHDDHCLLGRGPHFPPGFLSCLAGFAEPAETIEECAIREIREEAGVTIDNVRYQFSQPWPFPSSMMIGLFATAHDRHLTLDTNEIEEARWLSRPEIKSILAGDTSLNIYLPPNFTIARHLLERWVTPPQ